jgi:hypothetical protein
MNTDEHQKHQKVLQFISDLYFNKDALSQLEQDPFAEAFWCFRYDEDRKRLLSAIIDGREICNKERMTLLPFLNKRPDISQESITRFAETVAKLCWREVKQNVIAHPSFSIPTDAIRTFLAAILHIRKDSRIAPQWISPDWDESALFQAIKSEAQWEIDIGVVTLYALMGGEDAQSGVAELMVWREKRKGPKAKAVHFVGDYATDVEPTCQAEKNLDVALAGIRTVLINEPQTLQYLDESAFVVKMKRTLVEPANSNAPSIDGGSIGLPVAIAIYSLVTSRRLRPNITATGTVNDDGTISGVSAIPGKIKKLSVYNCIAHPPISMLIAPQGHTNEIQQQECQKYNVLKSLRCKFFNSLKTLLETPDLLFDPFRNHLVNLTSFDKSVLFEGHDLDFYRQVYQKSAKTENPAEEKSPHQIFPLPYGSASLPVAQFMAKQFAKARMEQFDQGHGELPPVPIIINSDEARNEEPISLLRKKFPEEDISTLDLYRQLGSQDGFVFICHGVTDETLNDYFNLEHGFFQQLSCHRVMVIARDYHQMAKYR